MASVTRLIFLWLLFLATSARAAPDAERTVKPVRFAAGSHSAVIKGSVKGYRYVDYQVRAGAGQQFAVGMQVGNRANYFNILPPESRDVAMFIEGAGERRFDGMLPDDGVYTVRVFLMRSAARRNETGNFSLSIDLTGTPLRPLSASVDALVPGTRYHASGKTSCEPPYVNERRECEAWVVRRGNDGTATVLLRWDAGGMRRILFVKGKPEIADVPQPFSFTRDERGYVIVFSGEARFEIPEALVFGG